MNWTAHAILMIFVILPQSIECESDGNSTSNVLPMVIQLTNTTLESVVDVYRHWTSSVMSRFGLNNIKSQQEIWNAFSCENKTTGYYADMSRMCSVFYLCYEGGQSTSSNSTGAFAMEKVAFFCDESSFFDQSVAACRKEPAISCDKSADYYAISNRPYNSSLASNVTEPRNMSGYFSNLLG